MQTFVSLSAILKYFSSRLNIWTMDSLVDRFILLKPVPSCLQYRILPGMLHYIFKYWSFKQFATFLQKIVNLCLHICCTFSSFLFFFFFLLTLFLVSLWRNPRPAQDSIRHTSEFFLQDYFIMFVLFWSSEKHFQWNKELFRRVLIISKWSVNHQTWY